jgi:NAD(P)H-flavin reductase
MESKLESAIMVQNGKDPMLTYPFYIQRLRHETHDTFTIELKPAREVEMRPFFPGQFNMLYVFGLGEVPISISGDPGNQERLVHTTRAVGAVTKAMRKLKRGNMIGVRGPFGTNWPVREAMGRDVLIVAGGIGLPPLRPALYHILSHRKEYGKVSLLYGTRTPEDILYIKELERWRARLDLEVFITVDRSMGDWRGNVGVVTTLIPKAPFDPHNSLAMVVGPEVMMRFSVLELQKRGLPDDRIYVSTERNMKCGVGLCGHCQLGGVFVCKDGPVFRFDRIKDAFTKREL